MLSLLMQLRKMLTSMKPVVFLHITTIRYVSINLILIDQLHSINDVTGALHSDKIELYAYSTGYETTFLYEE